MHRIFEEHGMSNMFSEGMKNNERCLKEDCDDVFSHLDGVRCVAFHPVESIVITGSEDRTLKLWNLEKSAFLRK